MEKAMAELQEKHRQGTNEVDDPNRTPTGEPYRRRQQEEQAARQQQQQLLKQQQANQQVEKRMIRPKKVTAFSDDEHDNNNNEGDDDSYVDDEEDDDPVLEAIRQRRLEEMKQAHVKHLENLAKGHGEVRTILQDEFLPECTGSSEWVAIHFFHSNFVKCQTMDHHLKRIAPLHTTCKFLRMDAEKAPFFVQKLRVRTLPTLLIFRHGQFVSRLTGFEGLVEVNPTALIGGATAAEAAAAADNFPTSRLQEWLAETGAIEYNGPSFDDISQGVGGGAGVGSIRRGGVDEFDD